MKKYFYMGILLGTFALSGCTADEVDHKEVTAESLTTKQSTASNNMANTTKTEEAAPLPLNLTKEQKEDYYQEYVAILEKVSTEYSEGFELELEPITEFLDKHWIEVEEFEKLAKDRANASIIVIENSERYNPMSVPKTAMIQIGSKEANIIFEGSFETKHTANTPGGRQLFSVFNSISSEVADADGSWDQFGHLALLKDGGVTYVIEVSGEYSQGGIISTHTMALKFNCDKNGGIS